MWVLGEVVGMLWEEAVWVLWEVMGVLWELV